MAKNNEWLFYGKSFYDALLSALAFEKELAPSLKKWESEFNTLDEKANALDFQLTEARTELVTVQAVGFADLREKRTAGKALSLAKDIHARSVEILRMELEQARANAAKFQLAELPFQHRRQMVRKVGLALFDVGGLAVKFQTADRGLDQTRTWIKKTEELTRSLAVLDGKGDNLDGPIGYGAAGAEETLGAAAVLPASALGQLVECWDRAVDENAARVALQFNVDKVLRWKILKKTFARQLITSHDVENYDVAGEARNGRRPQAKA